MINKNIACMRPYVTKAHVYKHTHTQYNVQRTVKQIHVKQTEDKHNIHTHNTTYNELLNKYMSNKQKINTIYTHTIQCTTNC